MSKAPKEREPVAGNIVSMAAPRFQTAEPVADDDAAVAFMPTDVSIEKARRIAPAPVESSEQPKPTADQGGSEAAERSQPSPKPKTTSPSTQRKKPASTPKVKASSRRVSLFFNDDMMLRIFKYAVHEGKDPNKALHLLIDESLEERGF